MKFQLVSVFTKHTLKMGFGLRFPSKYKINIIFVQLSSILIFYIMRREKASMHDTDKHFKHFDRYKLLNSSPAYVLR